MAELPEEIIFDILSRVPVKSVGLCRCVCKPWRAMLSQPAFIKTHLQLSKLNSLESFGILGCPDTVLEIYSAPLSNTNEDTLTTSLTKRSLSGCRADLHFRIYGSCDGLLLVLGMYSYTMLVMNPVTNEIGELPRLPMPRYRYCGEQYGFCYDPDNDDYKIVTTCTERAIDQTVVDVCSWKRLHGFPSKYSSCNRPGAFVGGCLRWIVCKTTFGDKYNEAVIVGFDLAGEKFQEVPLPSSISEDCYKVDVLGGCLCVCYERGMWYTSATNEVWVMKEYGVPESWTKVIVSKPYDERVTCIVLFHVI